VGGNEIYNVSCGREALQNEGRFMHWVACENVSVWGRVSHGVLRRRRRKWWVFL